MAYNNEVGTAEELLKRASSAFKRRQMYDSEMKRAYRLALPRRETFDKKAEGSDLRKGVFDSTLENATYIFTNRVVQMLFPSWKEWSTIIAGNEIPEERKEEINKELEEINAKMFDHIHRSNFDSQITEAVQDLAIGTGALLIQENTLPGAESALKFCAVPISEIGPEEGPDGTVETVWRKHLVKARLLKRVWPGATVSADTQKTIEESPDTDLQITEGSVYHPADNKYWNVVILEKNDGVIFSQPFDTNPWVVPRWSKMAGEIMGRGPVLRVLPDAMTLNKAKEFWLIGAARATAGVYTGVSSNIVNPRNMRLRPNTVIPVDTNDSGNPSLRELPNSGDANFAAVNIEQLQDSINKALFAEPLGDVSDPFKTATEQQIRFSEMLKQTGSSFGRLMTELVSKVVTRSYSILVDAGHVPNLKIDGKELDIKHKSPLSRAQDLEDLQSFNQAVGMISQLGEEVMMLGINVEDAPEFIMESLAVPKKLQRTEQQRQQLQQTVATLVAQQQQAEQGEPVE